MLLSSAAAAGTDTADASTETTQTGTAVPDENTTAGDAIAPAGRAITVVPTAEPLNEQSAGQAAFPDMTGHWAEAELRRAVELNLLKGADGKLLPDHAVKSSEALTILNRTLGATVAADISGLHQVPQSAWYAEEVAKAVHLGLIDPSDTRNFDTNATRAEAFVLLARAFVYERAESPDDALSAFPDAGSMTDEQRRAAAALVGTGIVKGDNKGALNPSAKLTRAEFVTMLLRIVPNFPAEKDDLIPLIGGALIGSDTALNSALPDGDRVFACGANEIVLSGVSATDRFVLKGMENASFRADSMTSLNLLAVDAAGSATLTLADGASVSTLVLAGQGGAVTYSGNAQNIEITASNRTIRLSGVQAASLTVTGSGNTIVVDGSAAVVSIASTAVNTVLTMNGQVDTMTVSGRGAKIGGTGKAGSIDVRAVGSEITLAADSHIENIDNGLAGVTLEMGVPTKVTAGGQLVTQVKFSGVTDPKLCSAQWYRDGKAMDGFGNDSFELAANTVSKITTGFEFTKDMAKSVTMGFKLTYFNHSTGENEERYVEKTVPIENYSDEWYYQRDVNRIMALVSHEYKGNYTAKYAINNDYKDYEKEVWINAKGYSSKTNYLIWINRAYQHVNIFTGSAGNWKLHRSTLVGTGADTSPTPTGLTTVSYKSAAGWTTETYTCKPVVGFYPGTGYAFHSRLYYPGTTKLMDSSIGYPISHGCIRMYDEDIKWIYDNIPIGTAVVIF